MAYTIGTILYAIDLSSHNTKVFQHAAGLAQGFGAKIHIIHALEPIGDFAHSMLDNYVPPQEQERLQKESYTAIHSKLKTRLEQLCKDELHVELNQLVAGIQLLEGRPSQVILEEAKRVGADLIVLGSHTHSALDEMLIGSVARKVTQNANVPVLLVPMREQS